MNTHDPHAFAYDACDIPSEMTIAEFRARRAAVGRGRTSLLRRLRRPLQMLRKRP
jgi:hypothetical protein